MCELPVGSSAELDKMIELVFEKAINDTNFANLYAEMCVTLEVPPCLIPIQRPV